MSEESRAVEFRRQQNARAAWMCLQRHGAFPSDPVRLAEFRANWLPRVDPQRGWDPVDCPETGKGLQVA